VAKHRNNTIVNRIQNILFKLKCFIQYLRIYNITMTNYLKDYFFYENLEREFTDEEIRKNYASLITKTSKITKSWNDTINSQWTIRDFIAIKMILSSTILLSSVEYAKTVNLKIVEPYLLYYSLLNCSRAVILTSPFVDWNENDLFTMTHSKTINIAGDIVSKFNKQKGKDIKKFIDWAREYREIFSYKFPANGLTEHKLKISDVIEKCKLLCEIAQFQSVILENSITKNVKQDFNFDTSLFKIGYMYGKDNFQFIDEEDRYRLSYIIRKQQRPYSLSSTMTEGMVEDFIGAWCPDPETEIETDFLYDPDLNWQIIFPLP